jgi:hypothetical protein
MYEIMKPKHVKKFMKSKESGTQNSWNLFSLLYTQEALAMGMWLL